MKEEKQEKGLTKQKFCYIIMVDYYFLSEFFMKKCLFLIFVGALAILLLTSCKKDSSGSDWYKDWLWNKTWGTTEAAETTQTPLEIVTTEPPEETASVPKETTSVPEETTSMPEETTAEPEETTTEPMETTTAPTETTTKSAYDWDDPYDPPVPPADTTKPTETTAEPEEITPTKPKETEPETIKKPTTPKETEPETTKKPTTPKETEPATTKPAETTAREPELTFPTIPLRPGNNI